MSENHQSITNHMAPAAKQDQYAKNFESYNEKDKAIIYILWQIHTKKLKVGSLIFLEPLQQLFGLKKTQWGLVKEFLSGANLVVNQVVFKDKISNELVERFDLLNE